MPCGNGGREEGDGRPGEREQRGHEQAPHEDGGDGRPLDHRGRRLAACKRDELAEDEEGGSEERDAPDGGVSAEEGSEPTEDCAEAERRRRGNASKSSSAHRAAARASTGAATGSSCRHDASAIPAPASCVRTASRSSNQVRQAIGPAAGRRLRRPTGG